MIRGKRVPLWPSCFHLTLETAHSALLVIDMRDEFARPNWTPFWVPDATRQVPRIKRLIEHYRAKKVPVIFTAFARTHNYADRPLTGSLMPNR
jgi:nicotinamidase-related amidase